MSAEYSKFFFNIVATCIIATIQTFFLVYIQSELVRTYEKIQTQNVIALFQKNYKYSDEVPRVHLASDL